MKRYISSAIRDITSEAVYIRFQEAKTSSRGDVLAKLAKDPDERVRNIVATNPNTPLDVLQQLAHDPYTVVRRGVTINPSASTDLILKTANSLENYSGEIELYFDLDSGDLQAAGQDDEYATVSSIVTRILKENGYSMYSDSMDSSGYYTCRCGVFNDRGQANEILAEVDNALGDEGIATVYANVERLLR